MKDSCSGENRIISLAPGVIDCSAPWLFWPEHPSDWFLQSMRDLGQLEPVLLEHSKDGCTLITGVKRVRACYAMERNVQGRSINAGELQKGEIYLHSNMHRIAGPLGLLPAARFFQMRCRSEDWPDWFNQIAAPFLELNQLNLLENWLKLDQYWDYYLTRGHISLDVSPWICEFKKQDLAAIEPVLFDSYWSRNNSLSLLKWIWEISQGRDWTVEQVLQNCGLFSVLEENISPKDRQKKILELLRSQRFPHIYFLQADFARLQKETAKARVWKIIPEQNFETNRLYVQAKVDNSQEVEKAVQELWELKENQAFEKIWQWQKDNLE